MLRGVAPSRTQGNLLLDRLLGADVAPAMILTQLTDPGFDPSWEQRQYGVVDLMESGVVNGVKKRLNRTKVVGTFALIGYLASTMDTELLPEVGDVSTDTHAIVCGPPVMFK